MSITPETPVGELATEHPLATRVFARHGIDFCCGGGRRLADACEAEGVDVAAVLSELETELAGHADEGVRWDAAPLPDLIDHIVRTFHEPLREELPRLEAMARKVEEVHGTKDPERLHAVHASIRSLQAELLLHMRKEEEILFPLIRDGRGALAGGPISVMESEHDEAGSLLRQLDTLTDHYRAPEDACNTWRALWAGLAELERTMHLHIHLENNILFPRALAT